MFDKYTYTWPMAKAENLTERTAFRCTKGQLIRWRAKAEAEGLTLSKWVAKQCDLAFTSPARTPSVIELQTSDFN
jgi:hypothetical protein